MSPVQFSTRDSEEAEHVVSETYLPHQLWVSGAKGVDFSLRRAHLGQTTAAIYSYGQTVQLHTAETADFYINVTLAGRVACSSGASEPLVTTTGQGFIFKVGEPAHLTWSEDCRQLALKAPCARVEAELQKLLGRSLPKPLRFDDGVRLDVGALWQPAVELATGGLEQGMGALRSAGVGEHLEGLLIDGLLLTQPHNYCELVFRDARPGPPTAVGRAAELLEESPGEPWTVLNLAHKVSLSVRALQYGFNRDFGMPPMVYLRRVRLQHAHRQLLAASPNTTTVRAVALACGLMHHGRFSNAYRQMFGESPSDTLAKRL